MNGLSFISLISSCGKFAFLIIFVYTCSLDAFGEQCTALNFDVSILSTPGLSCATGLRRQSRAHHSSGSQQPSPPNGCAAPWRPGGPESRSSSPSSGTSAGAAAVSEAQGGVQLFSVPQRGFSHRRQHWLQSIISDVTTFNTLD